MASSPQRSPTNFRRSVVGLRSCLDHTLLAERMESTQSRVSVQLLVSVPFPQNTGVTHRFWESGTVTVTPTVVVLVVIVAGLTVAEPPDSWAAVRYCKAAVWPAAAVCAGHDALPRPFEGRVASRLRDHVEAAEFHRGEEEDDQDRRRHGELDGRRPPVMRVAAARSGCRQAKCMAFSAPGVYWARITGMVCAKAWNAACNVAASEA